MLGKKVLVRQVEVSSKEKISTANNFLVFFFKAQKGQDRARQNLLKPLIQSANKRHCSNLSSRIIKTNLN